MNISSSVGSKLDHRKMRLNEEKIQFWTSRGPPKNPAYSVDSAYGPLYLEHPKEIIVHRAIRTCLARSNSKWSDVAGLVERKQNHGRDGLVRLKSKVYYAKNWQ